MTVRGDEESRNTRENLYALSSSIGPMDVMYKRLSRTIRSGIAQTTVGALAIWMVFYNWIGLSLEIQWCYSGKYYCVQRVVKGL